MILSSPNLKMVLWLNLGVSLHLSATIDNLEYSINSKMVELIGLNNTKLHALNEFSGWGK